MNIWDECQDRIVPERIENELIRVVESQEQIATNKLVDNLIEQDVLEQLLEQSKPGSIASTPHLHYLLATPFRYPPLKHGSRFGSAMEPSLFYGSLSLSTAFAETSYYRLLFWQGMAVSPASGKFITQHTVFAARYASAQGLKLQNPPFIEYKQYVSHPSSYGESQQLGKAMRQYGIEAFEFVSARDLDQGINVALYSQKALDSKRPLFQQQWICETRAEAVAFFSAKNSRVYQFSRESFLVQGEFPAPAL